MDGLILGVLDTSRRIAAPGVERREIYRSFLAELARRAPRLWLYGASSDNVAVNHVQAAAYASWFADHGGDELAPVRLHHRELLF